MPAIAGREQGRRVGLGAVAEHDVEQDHAGARVGRRLRQVLEPQRRVDHRVRAAARCRRRRRSRRTCARRRRRAASVATIRASLAMVPPTNSPRSKRRPPSRSIELVGSASPRDRPGRAPRGRAGAGPPRRRRSGRAGRGRAARTRPGWPATRRTPRISAATSSARRLGDHHDQLDGGVVVEPAQRLAGREPAHLGGQVATADAERGRRRRPRRGRAARAAAGSRCRTRRRCRPGRARWRWRSPRPSPPTTAVPQSGPITSRPRSAAVRLRATSWSSGTLSLKTITSRPASRASIASTSALAPGTDTSTSRVAGRRAARSRWCAAARPRRCPVSRRVGRAPAPTATAASAGVERAVRPPGGGRRPGRWGWPRPARRSPCPSSTSTLSGVAIATCAAATPGVSCTVRLTWSRVTESAYAPGRSSTWVVMRRRAPAVSRARASARAGEQAGAGGRADRGAGRPPGRARRACRARAARRANSGSTSPCSAQSSRVAESRVVRCEARRGRRRRRRASPTPAARWVASQPQSTSSPSGVRPSPRPTSRTDARPGRCRAGPWLRRTRPRGPGGWPRRWSSPPSCQGSVRGPARGVRTSTIRPTGSGLPPMWRTPASTYAESKESTEMLVKSRVLDRSAHGTCAAPAATSPTQRPPTSTYTASGPRWTTGTGPSGAARSRSRTRGGALTGQRLGVTARSAAARHASRR